MRRIDSGRRQGLACGDQLRGRGRQPRSVEARDHQEDRGGDERSQCAGELQWRARRCRATPCRHQSRLQQPWPTGEHFGTGWQLRRGAGRVPVSHHGGHELRLDDTRIPQLQHDIQCRHELLGTDGGERRGTATSGEFGAVTRTDNSTAEVERIALPDKCFGTDVYSADLFGRRARQRM